MTEAANANHKNALVEFQAFCDDYVRDKQEAMSENDYLAFCELSKKVHDTGVAVPRQAQSQGQPEFPSRDAAEEQAMEWVEEVRGDHPNGAQDMVLFLWDAFNTDDEHLQRAAMLTMVKLVSASNIYPYREYQDAIVSHNGLAELLRALKQTEVTSSYVNLVGNVVRLLAIDHKYNQMAMASIGMIPLITNKLLRMGRAAGKRAPFLVEAVGRLAHNNEITRDMISQTGIVEALVAWIPSREPHESYPDWVILRTLKMIMYERNYSKTSGSYKWEESTRKVMKRVVDTGGLDIIVKSRAFTSSDLCPHCCEVLEWIWSAFGQPAKEACWKAGIVSRLATVILNPDQNHEPYEKVDAFKLLGELGDVPGPIRASILQSNIVQLMVSMGESSDAVGDNTKMLNKLGVEMINRALRKLEQPPLFYRRLRHLGGKRPFSA
jgi:hypothetical protein